MAKQGGQTPLYEQVVKMVKDQIVSGVYSKGDLLPSEKEMIDNLGVSRITVRKALSILSDMGYIRTEKGRGSERRGRRQRTGHVRSERGGVRRAAFNHTSSRAARPNIVPPGRWRSVCRRYCAPRA